MSEGNNTEITAGTRVMVGGLVGTAQGNPWRDLNGTLLVNIRWDQEVYRGSNWFITLEPANRLEVVR
jgi:hypothetical protein